VPDLEHQVAGPSARRDVIQAKRSPSEIYNFTCKSLLV